MSAPLQPLLPPDSDPIVVELFARMQQQVAAQEKELNYSRLKIQLLEEKLRAMRIAKYGKASETLSDLQLELLDLEPGVSGEEVKAESDREPLVGSPDSSETEDADSAKQEQKRRHPGRQTLPTHLARVEEIIACAPDECFCGGCGEQTSVISYEESEVLDVKPAAYFVRVVRREKRACKRCEEQGVMVAAVAERILDKSLVSDQVIIDTVVRKYCDSLPLYRQSAIVKRDTGLEITRSTMTGWVMHVGELLIPLVSRMKKELLAGTYIQADETPVGVQTHDKRGKNHQAYLWQYGTPGGSVVFDFRMGREREGPKLFLDRYQGLLQTDGYAGYDRVGGPKMVHACCLAHARRKFIDAVKLDAHDKDSANIVKLMDELFAIDAKARAEKMDHAQRDLLRKEKAPALLGALRTQILAVQKSVLPKSAAGNAASKAASYTLSLWNKLILFLQYPELELSTNLAENSMRPVAIGRKNWIHLGSKEAGPKVAAIFSIVESCRRLGIPIREYLTATLPGLANRSIQSLHQLTPAAYAQNRTQ
jgi:transposase